MIDSNDAQGVALLLAVSPANKHRLVDAEAVLPAMAAVPPAILTGTRMSTLIELANPFEPQGVLARLRAAAAAPSPLALYLAGQIQLDRKSGDLYLALARSTPASMRSTALPWKWLVDALRQRPYGSPTTAFVDLTAEPSAWDALQKRALTIGGDVILRGRVGRPPSRGVAEPVYLKTCAAMLKSDRNIGLDELHEQAVARLRPDNSLILSDPSAELPRPHATSKRPGQHAKTPGSSHPDRSATAGDPHAQILSAARAGRHSEAADIVAMCESTDIRLHGTASLEAVHWVEVRADLARLAGDPARSCSLWLAAARTRLALHQELGAKEVVDAVDRAHHQWERVANASIMRSLAAELLLLRRLFPGRAGTLAAIQRSLDKIEETPSRKPSRVKRAIHRPLGQTLPSGMKELPSEPRPARA